MNLSTATDASPRIARQLILTGRVQGIGMRPAIARWAQQCSLAGFVANSAEGVELVVEGRSQDIARFECELYRRVPAAAVIAGLASRDVPPRGFRSFELSPAADRLHAHDETGRAVERQSMGGPVLSARVPVDVAVCSECLAEVKDSANRRHQYPFTSCTACGPRYSIINRMPYERDQTSMASFALCDGCRREYRSPDDRRFHAQTNACSVCGPQLRLCDVQGHVVASADEAMTAAVAALRAGRIVGLLGLGGYQLLVDATSELAVERLRTHKLRPKKPLAVMVASLDDAARAARLDAAERQALAGATGPIVIADAAHPSLLAPAVTMDGSTIGLMLPTTPLHGVLLDAVQGPLVCTSGNIEGEPLAYDANFERDAWAVLADFWLEHDRTIRRPIDDSVVRLMAGRTVTLRLARGFAPLPLQLTATQPLVALGGHQKAAIALYNGRQAVLGPHIGDLHSVATRLRFIEQVRELCTLYGMTADCSPPATGPLDDCPRTDAVLSGTKNSDVALSECQLVCDLHPDYFTTQWAEQQRHRLHRVQHHHAHIAAGMIEHGWLDRQVLGVAFDGTGYGTDGTIWGGEFLLATATGFERIGHLWPFPLAGGDRAAREPWRVATALVREACGDAEATRLRFQTGDPSALVPILRRPGLSPITTSAGRLFDGIASLVLGIEHCQFEGEAAMEFEAACKIPPGEHVSQATLIGDALIGEEEGRDHRLPSDAGYEMPIVGFGDSAQRLDWRPALLQILRDRTAGVAPAIIARRFHAGLAQAIFAYCRAFSPLPVVLGGGVFQNRMLVQRLADLFGRTGQPLGLPGEIPVNDGGLAAGQLAVAAARLRAGGTAACV